jgi:hypothetical protein
MGTDSSSPAHGEIESSTSLVRVHGVAERGLLIALGGLRVARKTGCRTKSIVIAE